MLIWKSYSFSFQNTTNYWNRLKMYLQILFFLDIRIEKITGLYSVMSNLPRAQRRPSRAPLISAPGGSPRHLWSPGGAQSTNRAESTGQAQSSFRPTLGQESACHVLLASRFWARFTHSEAHMEPTRSPKYLPTKYPPYKIPLRKSQKIFGRPFSVSPLDSSKVVKFNVFT